ncbi:SUKH-4 family immunity protein [Streptomyces sp. CBMA29]|uniref:SUKH-4 family immunity protein n=1 Tax=Streptomyces sp. CBMA29 TaxID=1896314 RepID=UPI001661B293|nr:SUKH-4 family immunity protein [Streptomyces sp. CBMA29]
MKIQLINIKTPDGKLTIETPRAFFGLTAADELTVTPNADHEEYIHFADLSPRPKFYIQQRTGNIVAGIDLDHLVFANTSITLFNSSVLEAASQYPYYSQESEPEEWELAAEALERALYRIDPLAVEPGTYWYEFRWSVAIGDYME